MTVEVYEGASAISEATVIVYMRDSKFIRIPLKEKLYMMSSANSCHYLVGRDEGWAHSEAIIFKAAQPNIYIISTQ